ncbi:MAG: hypothetical protein OSB02_12245 [Rhodospirillaceae bacterium]|jgi:hypothetical protein|nr:hypothetical protein [Rhodospirillaceae bacterium]
MAINETYLSILGALLDRRGEELVGSNWTRTMCLSYPDLLAPAGAISRLFGEDILAGLEVRKDSDQVKKYHGLPDSFGPVYETESLFEGLRIKPDFIDVKKLRGPEKIVDLNERLPSEYHGQYDLVIDTGTMEHCFNVGNAFRSMCELSKLGGHIISLSPMTMINHGFWNFSPTAYFDGFLQNGFEVNFLQGMFQSETGIKAIDFSSGPTERTMAPSEVTLICIAKKIKEQEFKWPVQSKYRDLLSSGT